MRHLVPTDHVEGPPGLVEHLIALVTRVHARDALVLVDIHAAHDHSGHVDHVYGDHASILKFIEHNWGVPPLSPRSRDNLPDPIMGQDPYRPVNGPAIGDLSSLFDFRRSAGREREGGP